MQWLAEIGTSGFTNFQREDVVKPGDMEFYGTLNKRGIIYYKDNQGNLAKIDFDASQISDLAEKLAKYGDDHAEQLEARKIVQEALNDLGFVERGNLLYDYTKHKNVGLEEAEKAIKKYRADKFKKELQRDDFAF